jgi:hypothetical protein
MQGLPSKLVLGADPQANAPGPAMLFETDTGGLRHGPDGQQCRL